MSKIIILEGIATSGKTSVKDELERILTQQGVSFQFVGEEETLMPLLNNRDSKVSSQYLINIVNKYLEVQKDIIVFDRLYLTHVWRCGGDVPAFKEVEKLLLENKTTLIFLEIPEDKVSQRIETALSHRDEKWVTYAKTKGETVGDIVSYYKHQQSDLLEILNTISTQNKVFNTGAMDFKVIAQKIALDFTS